jgi:hypothetical protein
LATPQLIRYLNAQSALSALFRHGGQSRADLARALGLNRSSIGNIVAGLLAEDLVIERPDAARPSDGRTGRPGVIVELRPEGVWFLGIEVELDCIGLVALNLVGHIVRRRSTLIDCRVLTPEAVINEAAALVDRTLMALPTPRRVGGMCDRSRSAHARRRGTPCSDSWPA